MAEVIDKSLSPLGLFQQDFCGRAIARQPVISRIAGEGSVERGESPDEEWLTKINCLGLPVHAGRKFVKSKADGDIPLKSKSFPGGVSEVVGSESLRRNRKPAAANAAMMQIAVKFTLIKILEYVAGGLNWKIGLAQNHKPIRVIAGIELAGGLQLSGYHPPSSPTRVHPFRDKAHIARKQFYIEPAFAEIVVDHDRGSIEKTGQLLT